jgi:hypothetical protein
VVVNEVLVEVAVEDAVLVVRSVCAVVVKVEEVVRLVEVLVERICVEMLVNVPWGEPVVVTVVLMVPVINGLSVVGASVVVAAVETEFVVKLDVTELVWVLKDVFVVETVVVTVVGINVKVAFNVTALLGIENVQGLVEHEIPV